MRPSRTRNLALLLAATLPATSVSAAAFDAVNTRSLFARDTSICGGNSNLNQCGQGLPSDFCCPKSTTCLSLNNTATAAALCCPPGSTCDFIEPVSCDLSQQDPTKHPESYLKVADLNVSLKSCGNNCCPLGYECNSGTCAMMDQTKRAPTSTASSTTSSPTATSKAPSSTSTPTGSSSPVTIEPTRQPNKFPAGAVLAGFFPGIVVGLLIAFAVMFLLRRRSKRKVDKEDRDSHIFGGPAPRAKISDPIYKPGMSDRSEFMHARTASGNSISPEHMLSSQQADLGFGRYYQPNQRPITGSTGTLVSPAQQELNKKSLGPPFETPTRPAHKPARVRALFSKSPSTRSKNSIKSRRTLGQSSGSLETIDILMRTQPGVGFPPPNLQPFKYKEGERPKTPTFDDVYRAAGVSPPKSEYDTRARPSVDTTRF